MTTVLVFAEVRRFDFEVWRTHSSSRGWTKARRYFLLVPLPSNCDETNVDSPTPNPQIVSSSSYL